MSWHRRRQNTRIPGGRSGFVEIVRGAETGTEIGTCTEAVARTLPSLP